MKIKISDIRSNDWRIVRVWEKQRAKEQGVSNFLKMEGRGFKIFKIWKCEKLSPEPSQMTKNGVQIEKFAAANGLGGRALRVFVPSFATLAA